MNVHRSNLASPLVFSALLALSGCVLSGQLDDTATESESMTSDAETEGSSSTSAGATADLSSSSSGPLESDSSSGDGDAVCADYTPPASACEPAGRVADTTFVGVSIGLGAGAPGLDDTECVVVGIDDDLGGIGGRVRFACPEEEVGISLASRSATFDLPFVEGDSLSLTFRAEYPESGYGSIVIRTLSGDLLLAYIIVNGWEPNIDLGTIEVLPGLSGCPAEPVPVASCSAGGSVAYQHTTLQVASGGAVSESVSGGRSTMVELENRSFLLSVDYALKTVCWDDDCTIDRQYVGAEGGMGFLLVAQPL